ncbi:MAG: hypothetical protein U0Q07_03535 [Acidimicrobiales bacterium]
MRKAIAAGALSASLIAGGAAGALLFAPAISGAQTPTTQAPATGQAPQGQPPADRSQWMNDALAPLVKDGTITQAQADAVTKALQAAKPQGGHGGPGGDHGGPGRGGPGLDAAATAIGISADELRTAVQSGQTIAQVAQAKGVDPQKVIDAIVAEMNKHFDEELASGEHTQAEVDQKKADAVQHATDMVNNTMPKGGPGGRGPRGGGQNGQGAPSGQNGQNGQSGSPSTTQPG